MIQIGDKLKLRTRITVKNIRRVKEDLGIDLVGDDTKPMLQFATDPILVIEVCSALYRDQFESAKIDQDKLEELCGPEEIEALRAEVTQQMGSFSKFWRILTTEMEGLQSGDTSLAAKAEAARAMGVNPQAVSGRSF